MDGNPFNYILRAIEMFIYFNPIILLQGIYPREVIQKKENVLYMKVLTKIFFLIKNFLKIYRCAAIGEILEW